MDRGTTESWFEEGIPGKRQDTVGRDVWTYEERRVGGKVRSASKSWSFANILVLR